MGWKNNIAESANNKIKYELNYEKHPLFELAFHFSNIFNQQKSNFAAALYNGGDLYLAPWVKSCYVNRAVWEGMTEAKQKQKFDKLIEGPKTIPEEVTSDGLTFKNKTTAARKKNQVRRGKTHTNPKTYKAASHQAEKDLEESEEEQFLEDDNNKAEVEESSENLTAFERLQKIIMEKGGLQKKKKTTKKQKPMVKPKPQIKKRKANNLTLADIVNQSDESDEDWNPKGSK